MAKTKGPFSTVVALAVWITGVLVSLAVGFGMIGENGVPTLAIQYIPDVVTIVAGWIVVILTLVSVILAIIDKLR